MSQPTFHLRPARPTDFATLWEIDQLCFSQEIAYTPAELRHSMREPGAVTLVAEAAGEDPNAGERGEIAGFIVASRPHPQIGHIITIDVRPAFRGQGIGHALMQAVEERFARAGVQRARLEAAVDNFPALQFYKKRGYQVVRRLAGYYPGPLDGLLLEKLFISSTQPAVAPESTRA